RRHAARRDGRGGDRGSALAALPLRRTTGGDVAVLDAGRRTSESEVRERGGGGVLPPCSRRRPPTLSRAEVGLTWQSLGDVLVLNGDYSEARIAYRRSRQHLRGDEDALATLALREGKLREHEGRYDLALRWYMRGLQRLDELGEARRSHHRLQLSLGYAAARYREGAFDECVEWVERVVADARTAGALEELAHAY